MRRWVGILIALAAIGAVPVSPASAQEVQLCESYQFEEPYPDWVAKLPPATPTGVQAEEVQVESADGTLVSAKIYHPTAFAGERLPTVLVMSPYHSLLAMYAKEEENMETTWADCITPFMLQRGYNVVLGDMRGTHNTDGCFDFGGRGDQEDGHAVVQWIAGQSWSNGNVGMYGVSHVGMSQYAAAVTTPPALKAIIPIAPITSFYRYLFHNGVHYEINEASPAAYEFGAGGPPPRNVGDPNWASNVLSTVSACGLQNVAKGTNAEDGAMDPYWQERDYPRMADRIKTPVYHVHGTLDENVKMDHMGAIWAALEKHDVPRKALVGPWEHDEPHVPNWHLHALRWYEHWLRNNDTGMMAEPTVWAIDQAENERFADSIPIGGQTVLEAGAGALRPSAAPGTATYTDVPGMRRADVQSTEGVHVSYTSDALAAPMRISGTPMLDIVASIDRDDTNFAVFLYDVEGDGARKYITRGYYDARLRDGLEKPTPVVPGEQFRVSVDLHPREWVVPEGHKLEVVISSSDSCAWTVDPECSAGSGVVSDQSAAAVTLHEGPGLTKLTLPTPPLDKVIRKPGASAPAAGAPAPVVAPPVVVKPGAGTAKLTVRARRARRGRLSVTGTAPAKLRVRIEVLRGKRVVARRTVWASAAGRFKATLRARGKGLRVRVKATTADGRRLSALSKRLR